MPTETLVPDTGYEANTRNLISLWRHFGSTTAQVTEDMLLHRSLAWPRRAWFDPRAQPEAVDLWRQAAELLPQGSVHVVWDMDQPDAHSWRTRMAAAQLQQQTVLTGMHLSATDLVPDVDETLQLQTIAGTAGAHNWSQFCGRCFGYSIDAQVIAGALSSPNIWLVMGLLDGTPVATALLHRTENVVGIHQVAVDTRYRGRGIARAMMRSLLANATERWQPVLFVLQASEQGRGLYHQLGFKQQFRMGLFGYTR